MLKQKTGGKLEDLLLHNLRYVHILHRDKSSKVIQRAHELQL